MATITEETPSQSHHVQQKATRKVAVSESTTSIVIREEPIPRPAGSQILIKLEASGVCATDLHLVRRSIPYLQPTVDVCGHEGIGRIVELGPDADTQKWRVGERVSHRWIYGVCRECEMCTGGNEQLCEKRKLSGKDVDGCWAGKSATSVYAARKYTHKIHH